ncbi:carbohydrate kinase family protein [Bacillus sp. EAC]|uniref:carbohydrate kinase family protein n=1 Tax=Bacillus sp. EAC TaxID=1978338 RepID=UPI000B43F13F|nr:carbohydrate kinase family protein [Bacillus sp. EAC]
MKKVLVLGGTTFDSIITLEKLPEPTPQTIHYAPFHETLGSTGAGKAINLRKLNVPSVLHSIIGDDLYGKNIIQSLQQEDVTFIYDIDEKGTERHVNLMDTDGKRISIFVTQSSDKPDLDLPRLEKLIQECDIVALNIIAYTKQLIALCKKYNKPIWTDLHDYNDHNPYHEDFIEIADYIFLSSDNLSDYKSVMKRFIDLGKQLVVCTHGKRGATALTKDGRWIKMDIIDDYKFRDANGAGDSFFSGFIYGFLQQKSTEDCLRFGTICAGLCITSAELAYDDLSEELLQQEYMKYYGKQ